MATGSSPISTGNVLTATRRRPGSRKADDLVGISLATLEEVEHEHIRKVLSHVADNKTKAAKILGINRVSLWRKIRNMKLPSAQSPAMPGGVNIVKQTAMAER